MKLRISINKLVLEISAWRPNVCLKWPGFQAATYFCPVLAPEGLISYWRQKSLFFRSGFVLRVLWFGFILRYGQMNTDQIPTFIIPPSRLLKTILIDERNAF
jgi:hypothetical protein